MRIFIKWATISLLILSANWLHAQNVDQENRDLLIERIEDLFEKEDAQIDLAEMTDAIENLIQNPVMINSGDLDELSRLFFIDEIKIHRIISYIYSYGEILSLNELYGIEGISPDEADLIAPFISLEQKPIIQKTRIKDIFKKGKHQIVSRYQRVLQKQRGYMEDSIALTMRYQGNPDKYYLRYRFKYRDQVSLGLTAEKDAGEEFFKGINQYGFDFYSLHFYLKNKNHILHKLAVGDYHLTFGQGLTMWSTYAFGSSSDGVTIKRNGDGITPNTSANENEFFRGAAATIKLKRHYLTGFVSHLNRDGTPSFNADEEVAYISSLTTDGMHRTENEIAKKNIVPMSVYGMRYEWRGYNLRIGATGFGSSLKIPLIRDDAPYNQFVFQGTSLVNAGADFAWILRNFEFFGESAYSDKGGFAGITGVRAHLASRFEASLLLRYYDKKYINLFANAFGVNARNSNEMGVYGGFNAILSPMLTLSGCADAYRFPYFKYQIWSPTRGNDYSLQLNINPSRNVNMYLRYRNSYREYGYSGDVVHQTYDRIKHNLRWQGDFNISKNIALKTRLEYVHNKTSEHKNGFLMYQDVIYKSSNARFLTSFRYAWFNTDSYDERMYAYESDLLYTFSVPAYYYKGNRIYLMCSYKISDITAIWLRISNTHYTDRETIGSGGEEIYGNNRTEIKAQVVIKL
ncbi:MAG: helix-hairpin-helix domain-containing protein [Bacteroidales bacterium]|jgi:hypothetical protein|nr:helix-hairpin-helix domain-containing protein [Bacteroidales bacterium]